MKSPEKQGEELLAQLGDPAYVKKKRKKKKRRTTREFQGMWSELREKFAFRFAREAKRSWELYRPRITNLAYQETRIAGAVRVKRMDLSMKDDDNGAFVDKTGESKTPKQRFADYEELGYGREMAILEHNLEEAFLGSKDTYWQRAAESVLSEAVKDLEEEDQDKVYETFRRAFAGFVGARGVFAGADFDLTDEQIFVYQRQSNIRYHLDPHGGPIIDHIVSYTIGQGIKFKCASEQVNDYLNEVYWNNNMMERRYRERFLDILLNGERFNKYKVMRDANTGGKFNIAIPITRIPPNEIREIEVRENEFKIAYKREWEDEKKKEEMLWYPDSELPKKLKRFGLKESQYFEADDDSTLITKVEPKGDKSTEDEFVSHMKIGFGLRGKPYSIRILQALQMYYEYLRDTHTIYHERTRVIFIEYRQKPGEEFETELHPAPQGGVMIRAMEGVVRYEFQNPEIPAQEAEKIGRIIRLTISAGDRTPEVISFMDASETLYASIRTTENPFTNLIVDNHDLLGDWTLREMRMFLEIGVAEGVINEMQKVKSFERGKVQEALSMFDSVVSNIESGTIVELEELAGHVKNIRAAFGEPEEIEIPAIDVPINITFPEVIRHDIKELTEALKIHDEMEWGDKRTIAAKFGYDLDTTIAENLKLRLMRQKQLQADQDRINQGGDPKIDGPKKSEEDE